MRAAEQRKEFAIDMEHDDIAALDADDLVAARQDVGGSGDNVTGHGSKSVKRAGVAVEDLAASARLGRATAPKKATGI
jgi:hypothetical protein